MFYLPLAQENNFQGQNAILTSDDAAKGDIVKTFLNSKLDELYFEYKPIRGFDWKTEFLNKTKQQEQNSKRKNTLMFKKVFIDSWKKKNIVPLIKKLDLSFQVVINNDIKYFVSNAKAKT